MLQWFSFLSGRKRWRVSLVEREATTVLDGAPRGWRFSGITYPATRSIYLDAAEARAEQDVVALHEICHAALVDAMLPDGIEERVVKALAPRLLPILKTLGLRFPPRPIGAAALERRARRLHAVSQRVDG